MARKFPAGFVKSVMKGEQMWLRAYLWHLSVASGPLGRSYVNLLREEHERQAAKRLEDKRADHVN